jgi:ribonuclease HII
MGAAPAILAGVDEAGLGPLLGSLALGWTALEVPAPDADCWKLLRGTVARKPGKRARIVVADSKVVFQRTARGEQRLETTALSFLGQLEGPPAGRLLSGLEGPHCPPWVARLGPPPVATSADAIELSTTLLARALERAHVGVLDAGVRLVPAAELNASFASTDNKAATVWEKLCEVLRRLWALHTRAPVHAVVDMLGGRRHYGSQLARALPEAEVTLVHERALTSAYALRARDGSGTMTIEFKVKGDRHSFPVALASCLAKYARELEMQAFNAFFAELQPALRPTAGYRTDGTRWLEEARPAIERSGVGRATLVRER